MTLTRLRRLAVTACVVLVLIAGGRATERLPAFDVLAYSLALTPDFNANTLAGTETIRFRSANPGLKEISFSPNGLTIDEARVNGRRVRVSADGQSLTFILSEALSRGRPATLRIAYHGSPRRGVTFSPTSVYTGYFACEWMICNQDAPGDKATFSLDLTVPAGMRSLSNGAMIGHSRRKDGREIHHWRTSLPYSAYLYNFAVGHFVTLSSRTDDAELFYLSDIASRQELQGMFGETGAMAKFLSERAGLKLPAGRYTQLLVAGGEAQESATYSIIGRENIDPNDDWVIIHELAHQWWGNSITCATWKDFWLNEGIAVFMTAAWKEHRFGRDAYERELDVARHRFAKAREQGWDKPLAYDGAYPSLGMRRAIQYSKGALFLHQLRGVLGEEAFWAGLRLYTQRHAGGLVTSIDLERAMEKNSGRDLSGIFREWVFGQPAGSLGSH